ncbi:MAG: quinoprotein dehydrogenase-associated SoxYZ-like carrier [Hyphomicrobiaceae bacterium]|nr:quinoprotein dehydrogenase-associated SoxYZ-like carrier [Hyphomicrobiaceae bacterium]
MSRRNVLGLSAWAMVAVALPSASAPAFAGSTWDGLRPEVFGTRAIESGLGVVTLKAPFRPADQRAVPIEINTRFGDGRTVKSVMLVVDENPSPVAATFQLGPNQRKFEVKAHVRLNQETRVRAIVEASDGALYMASQLVKFAGGQAACAAPPTGNPEEIVANMGKMQLSDVADLGTSTTIDHRVRLSISHPNHTGMALDQQTLLYIPLRMITDLAVRQGDVKLFDMNGSITISENPVFEFDVNLTGAHDVAVTLKDSDGTAWTRVLPIRAGS